MSERAYDIIVYGATGFAGRLVAEYIHEHHGEQITWAIAGRNAEKLAAVARGIGAPDLACIVADSRDPASLGAMAAATKVVCTTVGPYSLYGAELVAACVEHGTHYVDLTGEPQFVRSMIDAHHEQARENGTYSVHCCGFDSIPSDLGTRFLQEHAIQADGEPCDAVEAIMWWISGWFSGGTFATLGATLEQASDRAVRKVLGNPYSLAGGTGPDGTEQRKPRYSETGEVWTGPWVMATVNEKVVRRTNALLGYAYGEQFSYRESLKMGRGTRGRLRATAITAGMGAFTMALLSPLRPWVMKRLTPPGEGPSRESIENGGFELRLFGKRAGRVVHEVKVRGLRDPGYGATACMLTEAALVLVEGEATGEPGVTTPGAALGMPLVERLNATQVQFSASSTSAST